MPKAKQIHIPNLEVGHGPNRFMYHVDDRQSSIKSWEGPGLLTGGAAEGANLTNLHCAAEGGDIVVLDTGQVGALGAHADRTLLVTLIR